MRLVAQRISADSFDILASKWAVTGTRAVRQRIRHGLISMQSIDRLIECEFFCRPFHPQTS
jgi:hypothetical protein